MWTKWNDHAPKSECANFMEYMPKKGSFEKEKKRKIEYSLAFSCLHLPYPPQKKNFYHNNISLLRVLALFLLECLFCFSHHKTRWTMLAYSVGLKICLLGTSNSMVTLIFFFLCVNRSGPMTSSTTNHKFYRALGRLHDP